MGNYCWPWMVWTWLLSATLATPAQEQPAQDFLILRNGAALAGQVQRDGEVYILTSAGSTGESRYPSHMVLKVCTGSQQAYQVLKERYHEDDVQGRCRLAQFCLTHGLATQARAEIESALKLDQRNLQARGMLAQLEKRPVKRQETIPDLPKSSVAPLPAANLGDWPRATSQAGFSDFTKHIQPILLNGCGTGACHGTTEGQRAFLLGRGLYGAAPSPLLSRANLERVLSLVDQEQPDESDLLKRALQTHGGSKGPPLFGVDHPAYVHLKTWVLAISKSKSEPVFANTSPGAKPSTGGSFASGDGAIVPASASTPGESAYQNPSGAPPNTAAQTGFSSQNEPPAQAGGIPQPEQLPRTKPEGGKLPTIPGLSGQAAKQMGQPGPVSPPPPVKKGDDTKSPGKTSLDYSDSPEFQNYLKRWGIAAPLTGTPAAISQNTRLQNAGSYRISTPPQLTFPEEVLQQMTQKADVKKDQEPINPARLYFGGTPVNPPK